MRKWILQPMLWGLLATGVNVAIVNQAITTQVVALTKSTPKPVAKSPKVYRNQSDRFEFIYSGREFVVDSKIATPRNPDGSPLTAVDIWTHKHAQKIRVGAYAGGTEYPANVQLAVYSNNRRLPLRTWIQQSNQFSATREFRTAKIAGQIGTKFKSSGLYENDHAAFVNPENGRIFVITYSKTGYGNDDATYERAYQQVINSIRLLNN